MMILCVTPPSNTRTNEPSDVILGEVPTRWGDLNPAVAEELSKHVHRLWLHAAQLDFTCRAQLLQSWGESPLTTNARRMTGNAAGRCALLRHPPRPALL